jgi:lysophospholipase II
LPKLFPNIKWIFPTFNVWRSKKENELGMKKWFDMWNVEQPREREIVQRKGLRDSIKFICDLVKAEMKLVPPEQIILVGFGEKALSYFGLFHDILRRPCHLSKVSLREKMLTSLLTKGGVGQGGAVAAHALLAAGIKFGGFIGISTWMPFQQDMFELGHMLKSGLHEAISENLAEIWGIELPGALRRKWEVNLVPHLRKVGNVPVFLAHAIKDPAVNFSLGTSLGQCLTPFTTNAVFRMYDHDKHWPNDAAGMDDLARYIIKSKVLAILEKEKEASSLRDGEASDTAHSIR